MTVVMARVDAKHVLELAAAEDEQAVEALATDAADLVAPFRPTLRVRLSPRRFEPPDGFMHPTRFAVDAQHVERHERQRRGRA